MLAYDVSLLKAKPKVVFQKKSALSQMNVEALDLYVNLMSTSTQLVNAKCHGEVVEKTLN
jgi:hypothetical protein